MEAKKIPTFACVSHNSLSNASVEINIDMVKPMEASMPKPTIVRLVMTLGKVAQRILTIKKVAPTTPRGFPMSKPKATPSATWLENISDTLKFVKLIPALEMAKIGIMRNVTTGIKVCSSCCSKGIAMEVSRLMVANTPTCPSSKVLTSLAFSCSKRFNCFFKRLIYTDSFILASAGIIKAASTAAIVAWIPDSKKVTQTPPIPSIA